MTGEDKADASYGDSTQAADKDQYVEYDGGKVRKVFSDAGKTQLKVESTMMTGASGWRKKIMRAPKKHGTYAMPAVQCLAYMRKAWLIPLMKVLNRERCRSTEPGNWVQYTRRSNMLLPMSSQTIWATCAPLQKTAVEEFIGTLFCPENVQNRHLRFLAILIL